MGFLDKAKAAANDLAAKADTAINSGLSSSGVSTPAPPPGGSPGQADALLRDLGALAYVEANGRPVSGEDRERILSALRGLEATGALGDLSPRTATPGPGAPGPGATPPPSAASPPPPSSASPQTPPPPPPPSWMNKGDGSS